jgi:hypothetical protein
MESVEEAAAVLGEDERAGSGWRWWGKPHPTWAGSGGAEGTGVEVGREAGRFRVIAGAAVGMAHGRGDGQHWGFE